MDSRDPTSSPPPPARSPPRKRSLSPARLRRDKLLFDLNNVPRSYIVEAISAIPHPVPIHSLAASACMSHLLTGAEDGYIRDYDIFAAVNSKNFLTAPQRHHAGVVEGLMKSHQLRFWWENPALPESKTPGVLGPDEDPGFAPVYSLAMHPDALWALAGTDGGYINLFTVRHDPGRLIHVMQGHRGPVSGLALDYDYKSLFSASWDGDAIQWDLNTGQNVRSFTAHNSQITSIGLRPRVSSYVDTAPPVYTQSILQQTVTEPPVNEKPLYTMEDLDQKPLLSFDEAMAVEPRLSPSQEHSGENGINSMGNDEPSNNPTSQNVVADSDARSDASFDPLFDDVPEDNEEQKPSTTPAESKLAMPGSSQAQTTLPPPIQQRQQAAPAVIPPPKGAPPLFDPVDYSSFSQDILMTSYIDGQVILWDRRAQANGRGVGRLWMSEKTPPWCLSACWSWDGAQIYAGRRNGTVDVWDVRVLGQSGPANTPRLLKTLRNPTSSGVVSCVVSFPDCRHLASASVDNIRLWNVAESGDDAWGKPKSGVPFKIIPGHHGGYISQMLVDPASRFLVSASSNRGWYGDSTRTVFVHDIKRIE
ncbi:WD40 repeat-like protein [Agrocybe pediades]|nr:WD40 repeat-like protein [Agrocybe pediades]